MIVTLAIISLAGAYFENNLLRILFGFLAICKIVAYMHSSGLELRYSKDNKLFKEFCDKSRITKLRFEPYIFAPIAFFQAFVYLFSEKIYRALFLNKFNREELVLPCGATIALDWDGDIPDSKERPDRPILLICPGMGGDSRNLYSLAILW